jgi:hypothetical protein
MKIEQRLYPRCSTLEAEFRVFSHDTKIIGRLVNIGQKGLAFRYTPKPGNTAEFKLIDILGTGPARWHLPEVACESAYDISVLAENQTFTGSETRLCGLQFIQLTIEQKERLAILLEQCDAGTHNTILTRRLDSLMIGFDPLSGFSPAAG